MFKRILVPLDGSQTSAQALPYAIEVAKRFGADLMLLQVVEPASPSTGLTARAGVGIRTSVIDIAAEAAKQQDKTNIARAKRYLSSKLQSATEQGIKGSYHVVTGAPAKSILKFCKREHVSLVVLTTSGKGGIKRALFGSVADELIRDPSVPELVIRPKTQRKVTNSA